MTQANDKILAVDIGGSHIKATLLDAAGNILSPYERMVTPSPADPAGVTNCIVQLAGKLPGYNKVSAGFPGLVRRGIVLTAPNLDASSWKNIDLAGMLATRLSAPTRVVNDADMLGLGTVSGEGFEMMVTLGTGFGTAFLLNGRLLPHLEIAHHPFAKKKTYDEYIGNAAYKTLGKKKWNRRIQKILPVLNSVFCYERLYVGGGNAGNITGSLPADVHIVTNRDGIHGGAKLWESTED